MRFVSSLLLVLAVTALSVSAVNYKQLAKFTVANPAFFMVAPFQLQGSEPTPSLFISSFTGNPFATGSVYIVENIKSYVDNFGSIAPVSLGFTFQWPNLISAIPNEAQQQLKITNAFIVPDGFLVPGKDNGGLYIVSQTSPSAARHHHHHKSAHANALPSPYQITAAEDGYFYHSALWVDLNGDGLLDVLSAKATKPLFGSGSGSLVWLEQPATGLASLPWQEHVITAGPDVFFTIVEVDGDDSTIDVVAGEFFGEQLSLNIISATNGSLVLRTIIDNTIGPVDRVDVAYLNGNNSAPQLLVTNHIDDVTKSAVFAYDIPSDLTGEWTRYTLATGFPVTEGGFSQAAPGLSYGVHPTIAEGEDVREHILVAGDGSQSAYLLRPASEINEFTKEMIINTTGTVGALYVTDDWNNDGFREFLVPDYDHSTVYVYTFTD